MIRQREMATVAVVTRSIRVSSMEASNAQETRAPRGRRGGFNRGRGGSSGRVRGGDRGRQRRVEEAFRRTPQTMQRAQQQSHDTVGMRLPSVEMNDENECFICSRCAHHVCMSCMGRMRVLGGKTQCPVCRDEQTEVLVIESDKLSQTPSDFSTCFRDKVFTQKHGIYFASERARNYFAELLAFVCTKCSDRPKFDDFDKLDRHMRRQHELFYCELCAANLELFPWERRVYDRRALAEHRRKGDPDDRSYDMHPLCEFCETRFYDADDLYRHMRREHFYCNVCENESGMMQMTRSEDRQVLFHPTAESLRAHFAKRHYVCDLCIDVPFGAATAQELKQHKQEEHGPTKRTGERIVQVEWNYGSSAPSRDRDDRNYRGRGGRDGRGRYAEGERTRKREATERQRIPSGDRKSPEEPQSGFEARPGDFPQLPNDDSAPAGAMKPTYATRYMRTGKPKFANHDFPSLSAANAATHMEAPPPPERDPELLALQTKGMQMIDDSEQEGYFKSDEARRAATKLERAKQKAAAAAEQKTSTTSRQTPSPPPGFEALSPSAMTRPPIAAMPQPVQRATSSKEAYDKAHSQAPRPPTKETMYNGTDFPALGSTVSATTTASVSKPKTMASIVKQEKQPTKPIVVAQPKRAALTLQSINDDNFPALVQRQVAQPVPSNSLPSTTSSTEQTSTSEFKFVKPAGMQQSSNASQNSFSYIYPQDYERRYKSLCESIIRLTTASRRKAPAPMPGDEPAVQQFRSGVDALVHRKISGDEFYIKMRDLLGKAHMTSLFPEMLALVPSTKAQHALLKAFEHQGGKLSNTNATGNTQRGPWQKTQSQFAGCTLKHDQLLICNTCAQVLVMDDYNKHMYMHTADDTFPTLG